MKIKNKNRHLLIVCYLVLISIAFVFVLFRYLKAEREKRDTINSTSNIVNINNYDTDYLVGKQFIDFNLEDLTGNNWRLSTIDSLLKIAIIFNINDCARCLQEYRIWNQIAKKYSPKIMTLFGICNNEIQNIVEYRHNKNILYPILHDPRSIVKETMGIKYSPLFIIIGRNNEILNATIPGNQSSKQLLSMIDSIIEKSEKGAVSLNDRQKEERQ